MTEGRLHKIALLGVDAPSDRDESLRWECFGWDFPKSQANLHDFDTWVLFLPTFPERIKKDTVYTLLNVNYVYEALSSQTRIFVIGDPRFELFIENYGTRKFLHWTGYEFSWKDVGGDTIKVTDDALFFSVREYLLRISRWEYAMKYYTRSENHQYENIVQEAGAAGRGLHLYPRVLAVNRNDEAISWVMQLRSFKVNHPQVDPTYLENIVFLPLGQLEAQDSLRMILREATGLSLSNEPPDWIDDIVVVNQQEIDSSIAEIKETLAAEQLKYQGALRIRQRLRDCLGVLYQLGTPLEVSVKALLSELGAIIEEPEQKGYCDGYLRVKFEDSERPAVLEIKGTLKQTFDLKGFKQLLQWRQEAMLQHGHEYRAIFVGNPDAMTAPLERGDAFGNEWIKQTKLHKVTVLTTTTLYAAYQAFRQGTLDVDRFWTLIFETDGVVYPGLFIVNTDKTGGVEQI